ncbi:MAG TPA: F0F1 ATP synthase subunit epsilon [Bryobacteraceae bacterium]|nr:F0F1 ATP synthase subunit epsilon [Bryobacteraceae bacterium]
MRLTVRLPSQILLEQEEVDRIKAEAENGWFGLLPRHIDFVTALVPGVMTFQPCGKPEEYLAIDRGILVKCGAEVSVSTRNAVRGASLEKLQEEVQRQFRAREEREKAARAFEAKLEADLVRHLMEAEKNA